MHVALISPSWPPERALNGITTYVGHMRQGFVDRGHEVSVLSIAAAASEVAHQVWPVVPSLSRRLRRRLSGWLSPSATRSNGAFAHGEVIADALRQLHRTKPIDLVEIEESFGWCHDVQRLTGLPTVVKLHGPAFLSFVDEARAQPAARHQIAVEADALRACRYITSPSAITLSETVRECELTPRLSKTLPNPIVMPEGLPLWAPERSDPNTLLFVGRFDKRKGGDFVLKAFLELLHRRPQLRLVFIGPDPGVAQADGHVLHLAEVLEKTYPPEWRGRVEHLGPKPRDEVNAWRTRCAATLVCSRWDNQPNTALEAMLQACPLVSTNAGSMSDTVQQGLNGWLYEAEDVQDFCNVVQSVLDAPEQGRSVGLSARDHVLARHDPLTAADAAMAFYGEVLADARHP